MLKNLHHYNFFFSFSKGKYDFVRAINFYEKNKYSKAMEKEVSQIPIKFNLKASSIFERKSNQN